MKFYATGARAQTKNGNGYFSKAIWTRESLGCRAGQTGHQDLILEGRIFVKWIIWIKSQAAWPVSIDAACLLGVTENSIWKIQMLLSQILTFIERVVPPAKFCGKPVTFSFNFWCDLHTGPVGAS